MASSNDFTGRTLTCNLLFDGESLRGPSVLTFGDDGRILSIRDHTGAVDVHLLAPGLVDLQMNGFDDVDVADAAPEQFVQLDIALRAVGTSHYLATLVTAPLEVMHRRVIGIDQHARGSASCLGTHLEGPFLGNAPGAHDRRHVRAADLAWLASLPSSVRIVTLAPEQEGAVDAVSFLRANGVIPSLGHSKPSSAATARCIDAGARMATHLFNAMSPVHHRDDSLALTALVDDRLVVGVISDTVHVQPDAVNLAFRAKPDGTIVLVSDSIAWSAPWAKSRGISVRDGAPRLADGTLAGSSTPLARCMALAVNQCGVALPRALRAATSAPADLIGRPDLGRLREGEMSSVVGFDQHLAVVGVR